MSDSDEEIYKIEETCQISFLQYGDVGDEFVETVLRPNLTAQTGCLFMFSWTLEEIAADIKMAHEEEFPNEVAKVEAALFHLASIEPGLVLSGPIENIKISKLNDLCAKHAAESEELLVFEQGPGLPILGLFSTYDSAKKAESMVVSRLGHDIPEASGAVVVNVADLDIFSLNETQSATLPK